jgi:putative DNA primase/helicase
VSAEKLSPDERAAAEATLAELRGVTADNDGPVSDDDLARRFTARHENDFKFCAALGRWFVWDGSRYKPDATGRAFDEVRRSIRLDLGIVLQTSHEAQKKAIRARLGSAATVAAVTRLIQADRAHAVEVADLDADPWVLNTPTGVLCLKTGQLSPSDPTKPHTKLTAAAPSTECPNFLRVLERVLPDREEREYIQRLAGYAMTGVVSEHVIALTYGTGANGKSLVFNSIRYALGDYAVTLPSETLMESHNDRHPTEIAVLRGARFALASEIDSGRRWNESRLKRLSGGDPISARFISRDPFEFLPSHKLVLLANAKPGLRVVDEAIRRRIHLIDFGVTIPPEERDSSLPEKLQAEAGGILGWALTGCLDWQDGGLRPPKSVLDASEAYLYREDAISQWIAEQTRPLGQSSLTTLHVAYRAWCETNAVSPLGRNQFGDQLEARGIERREVRPRVWMFALTPANEMGIRRVS